MLFEYIFSGFIVGSLVGLTGVGGGSLMTPLLVLFFKFPTAIAVGTDLLYAAITKSAGAISHHRLGHVDWKIVRNLLIGSLPASYLVTHHLKDIDLYSLQNVQIINTSLGIALILTSIAVLFQPIIIQKSVKQKLKTSLNINTLTVMLGIFLGSVVTLTSVGAGAIGVTALLLLYPKLQLKKIIGTDIAHAVPLTFFAGIGHFNLGTIDINLLMALLIGSVPGVMIGSKLSAKIDEKILRFILVIILLVVGVQLIFKANYV
ncbi:MAG: sulfite exporter TauE/SafE family protein [Nitrosomonadales bacterium]|nr:sulfite exporter TauE/SafE family protein [Nitrosomonadales bacterium]MBT3917703.1 sulfite exporter TauE/SafE family protein [Nitrosomonadales bacterium]MBT4182731.1 sulfite exporter TauE/SafE family protein [Nitrosomonadales bacterium]MBT4570822.1 sulfite exporter TauE/SafE family protein [Nitrosomonadales bacterium]MBT4759896.1 sulfite exporter TauE/SafE family protein [Nitrosomonadales bacterium]